MTIPDQITLTIDGPGGRQEHQLAPGTIVLGRAPDNTIPLPDDQVSRRHAQIEINGNRWTVTDLGSTNGTLLNGTRLAQDQPAALHPADAVQIAPFTIHVRAAGSPPPIAESPLAGTHDVSRPTTITIGRASDNTVVLDHPQASRYHAVVEKTENAVKLSDLGSTNGTFVNGQRLTSPRPLQEGDIVQIAMFRFELRAGQLQQFNDQGNIGIDAYHLIKTVGKGMRVINEVSISIRPREFVAIVGGSGAGKSTLLDALNGFRPATEGAVLYNGMDLYQNFDAYRNAIGYVPQDDIIHRELTVYGALNYVAQLRLSRDTTDQEREQRIEQVMKDLGLEQRRDTPIHRLSGGQRKRVSIGVELLSQPSLLFLDEPTSGLDPSTETKMMRLMRDLANQGRTVILVTHVTGNVSLCDKVIIMARGGRLAFYGPPKDALPFFKVNDFVDIYDQLDNAKPEDLQKNYEQSAQYRQLIVQPLQAQVAESAKAERATRAKPGFKGISALRQFIVLSRRNLEILVRDRASLALMLLLAPIIGAMDLITWNRQLFDLTAGSATQSITMLYILAIVCILVGSIASMREIVKEAEIYRRERMVGLGIVPYILSKVWLGGLLALYQGLIFLIFKVLAVPSMPHDPLTLILMYVTLVLATLLGMLMGLFVSAIAPNQNVAPLLVILLLVPQFLFSGGLLPIKTVPGGTFLSAATSARWAFESFTTISKLGSDVANDQCWLLSSATADPSFARQTDESDDRALERWQDSKDENFKRQNCACLGPNIFSACRFPGIDDKFTTDVRQAVNTLEPVQPTKPGDLPTQPDKPPAYPECNPLEAPCQQRLKDWQNAFKNWKDQMDTWKDKVDRYTTQVSSYQDDMSKWQDAYTAWKEKRDRAIGNAEGTVRAVYENYGNTFNVNLAINWSAMGIIMSVFFALILIAQKRKDISGR